MRLEKGKDLLGLAKFVIKPDVRTSEKDDRRIHIAIAKWTQIHFSQSGFHFIFLAKIAKYTLKHGWRLYTAKS